VLLLGTIKLKTENNTVRACLSLVCLVQSPCLCSALYWVLVSEQINDDDDNDNDDD